MAATEAQLRLARQLRRLRQEWRHGRVTQMQVAEAFGVSFQLVSSWESLRSPQTPSADRLADYARFFATPRSLTEGRPRLVPLPELTDEELRDYEKLVAELQSLRDNVASAEDAAQNQRSAPAAGFWSFEDGLPIVIIGSEQPPEVLASMRLANPRHPDYVKSLRHADADAVFEVTAEIRAQNPRSSVQVLLTGEVQPSRDLTAGHVVVIGGNEVNDYATWFAAEGGLRLEATLRVGTEQVGWSGRRFLVSPEYLPQGLGAAEYEDTASGRWAVYRAEFQGTVRLPTRQTGTGQPPGQEDRPALYRDVALIARQPNPLLPRATATLIHGLFARGTYGATRALTDPEVRGSNEAHLATHFPGATGFGLLISVFCDRRLPVTRTPDFNDPRTVLLAWSG